MFHNEDSIAVLENLPRPRFIKSYLPVFLLPDNFWDVKSTVKELFGVYNLNERNFKFQVVYATKKKLKISMTSLNEFVILLMLVVNPLNLLRTDSLEQIIQLH